MVEPRKDKTLLSPHFGNSHGDTKHFDDLEELGWEEVPLMKRVAILHDNKLAFGLFVEYENPRTKEVVQFLRGKEDPKVLRREELVLAEGEFISHLSGRSGNIVDCIVLKTNNGKTIRGGGNGGEARTIPLPSNTRIVAFAGGYGGHIHNLKCHYLKQVGEKGGLEGAYPDWASAVVPSNEFGKKRGDTVEFDDFHSLKHWEVPPRIAKVVLYHNGSLAMGWKITYVNDATGEIYVSRGFDGVKDDKEVLELEEDEYLVKLDGNQGDLIDSIRFVTNKGRCIKGGGDGGGPASCIIGKHSKIVALAGGYGGNNICLMALCKAYYLPLIGKQQKSDYTYEKMLKVNSFVDYKPGQSSFGPSY